VRSKAEVVNQMYDDSMEKPLLGSVFACHEARAGSPSRGTKTLKRTISKCGIDQQIGRNHDTSVKKVAVEVNRPVYDENEPVLLPRHARLVLEDLMDESNSLNEEHEPELSPFGWDDSPHTMKHRYYESILESSTAFVSPSPQHFLYPSTPLDHSDHGYDSASTISLDLSISPYPTTEPTPAHTLVDRDSLTPATLLQLVMDYLGDVFTYYTRAKTFTFAHLGDMIQSVPSTFRYIQRIVKNRLHLSWHLVGSFVEHVLDFICDEDIREATVYEFSLFLSSVQEASMNFQFQLPCTNIFGNLFEFFHYVLKKFKCYLISVWVQTRKITFPCEFGKKSTTLFLCMECHREHL
jgi:hypothetical protein